MAVKVVPVRPTFTIVLTFGTEMRCLHAVRCRALRPQEDLEIHTACSPGSSCRANLEAQGPGENESRSFTNLLTNQIVAHWGTVHKSTHLWLALLEMVPCWYYSRPLAPAFTAEYWSLPWRTPVKQLSKMIMGSAVPQSSPFLMCCPGCEACGEVSDRWSGLVGAELLKTKDFYGLWL